jgi:hypothetical protein
VPVLNVPTVLKVLVPTVLVLTVLVLNVPCTVSTF